MSGSRVDRRIFLMGRRAENGRASPLKKMTSTAYGGGRDFLADALAERCPVSAFFITPVVSGDLLGEECCTRHAPSGRGHVFADAVDAGA
ncbi:MAG: hypothetical protein DRJ65_14470 [Acidobacteria bacterium]|nr:MAG: hypothetical protein DRJ65_14470 [Acidobacteriota bacterium]